MSRGEGNALVPNIFGAGTGPMVGDLLRTPSRISISADGRLRIPHACWTGFCPLHPASAECGFLEEQYGKNDRAHW